MNIEKFRVVRKLSQDSAPPSQNQEIKKMCQRESKFKALRSNSYKDTPISQILNQGNYESPIRETGKNKEQQPVIPSPPTPEGSRKRIYSQVLDNPFLKTRRNLLDKEKEKIPKKIQFPFQQVDNSYVLDDRVSFRMVRQQIEKRRLAQQQKEVSSSTRQTKN